MGFPNAQPPNTHSLFYKAQYLFSIMIKLFIFGVFTGTAINFFQLTFYSKIENVKGNKTDGFMSRRFTMFFNSKDSLTNFYILTPLSLDTVA